MEIREKEDDWIGVVVGVAFGGLSRLGGVHG